MPKYHSCFICYSSQDQDFAEQLHSDLRQNGVDCWFALKDMRIGARIRPTIHQTIRSKDKMLLILSANSIDSAWVESEVEAAFEEETKRGDVILFPIRLDDTVMQTHQAWAATIRQGRYIGDFSHWQDEAAYQEGLSRLLDDLQIEEAVESGSSQPSTSNLDDASHKTTRIQSLRRQLKRYYENLNTLEEEEAEYGTLGVPTRLRNEIKATKRKIAEIEQELHQLGQ